MTPMRVLGIIGLIVLAVVLVTVLFTYTSLMPA